MKPLLFVAFSIFLLSISTSFSSAANPGTPITPSMNVQDPGAVTTPWGGCGPTDTNCYVDLNAGAANFSSLTVTGPSILTGGTTINASGSGTTSIGNVLSVTTIAGSTNFTGPVSFSTAPVLPLSSGSLWIGNGSNVATAVLLSGDATVTNTGILTITNDAVTLAKLASNAVDSSKVADDTLNFSKFSDALALDVSTDIGVGSNTLSITNDGSGTSLLVNDGGIGDTTPFAIDGTGRVGIGTSAPSYPLDVKGPARILDPSPSLYLWDSDHTASSAGYAAVVSLRDSSGTEFAYLGDGSSTDNALRVMQLTSAPLALGTAGIDRLVVADNGRVGVGTNAPGDLLDVRGDIRVGTGTDGCVKDADGSVIAGTCPSDQHLKTDIQPLATGLIERLVRLEPVTYRWNDVAAQKYNYPTDRSQLGLIAQQVETVMPDLVRQADDTLRVRYADLPVLLLQGIRDIWTSMKSGDAAAAQRIDSLEARVADLERRIQDLAPQPAPPAEPAPLIAQ